jgi:hypothetical protein
MTPAFFSTLLETVEKVAGCSGVVLAPLVDHVVVITAFGEPRERVSEFGSLGCDQCGRITTEPFGETQLDEKLDPQIPHMIDRSHEPTLQACFALASCSYHGAVRPSVARFCGDPFDEFTLVKTVERSVDQWSMHRQNPAKV